MITFKDYIFEVAKWKSIVPDLARSVEDQLKKYEVNGEIPDNIFISYTKLPNKVGINPKSIYNTPLGVYVYPLNYYWKKFKNPNKNYHDSESGLLMNYDDYWKDYEMDNNKSFSNFSETIPFESKQPFIQIIRTKPDFKWLDFDNNISKNEFDTCLTKLKNIDEYKSILTDEFIKNTYRILKFNTGLSSELFNITRLLSTEAVTKNNDYHIPILKKTENRMEKDKKISNFLKDLSKKSDNSMALYNITNAHAEHPSNIINANNQLPIIVKWHLNENISLEDLKEYYNKYVNLRRLHNKIDISNMSFSEFKSIIDSTLPIADPIMVKWTYILRNILGFDGAKGGWGSIHSNEKVQAVIFSINKIDHIDTIENRNKL